METFECCCRPQTVSRDLNLFNVLRNKTQQFFADSTTWLMKWIPSNAIIWFVCTSVDWPIAHSTYTVVVFYYMSLTKTIAQIKCIKWIVHISEALAAFGDIQFLVCSIYIRPKLSCHRYIFAILFTRFDWLISICLCPNIIKQRQRFWRAIYKLKLILSLCNDERNWIFLNEKKTRRKMSLKTELCHMSFLKIFRSSENWENTIMLSNIPERHFM